MGFRVDLRRYPEGFRPPGGIDWRTFRSQVWVTLTTRHGDIDIVFGPRTGPTGMRRIAQTATRERLVGTEIAAPVASAEMILHSKTAADRPKDHAVLWTACARSSTPSRQARDTSRGPHAKDTSALAAHANHLSANANARGSIADLTLALP